VYTAKSLLLQSGRSMKLQHEVRAGHTSDKDKRAIENTIHVRRFPSTR
jgi:hypothetical protein